ncbi:rhodanese-like protein [Prevotella sp. BV3P1]|uniref:rhodanese-like domain-containing protein n=1 Tax=Prevotellaceae TaxID=171552 RepID=UPI0003B8820E|nr:MULTISPECIES: rhodanese-like domain-containing protein [Prevotellaceae]ERT61236.1 rhodanese-like protein [Prevotella sp. BV3P1]KGF42851.1 rhodanese [Hoylesella buccalis DNF00985]
MNNILKGFIIVILSTLFASCSSHQGIESVTADEFENALYDGHVQLLDVRSVEEYAQGHIANAENIDVQQPDFIDKAQAKLDHANPVYVYCRSGKRSMLAAQKLVKAGFKVVNLRDGIMGWEDAGKPVLP